MAGSARSWHSAAVFRFLEGGRTESLVLPTRGAPGNARGRGPAETRALAVAGDGPAQSSTMAPQAWTTNTGDLSPNPAGYQVDDLIIDLAPRRVRRAEAVIPLKALSFDLLIALVRAAPNLLSFDQLSER